MRASRRPFRLVLKLLAAVSAAAAWFVVTAAVQPTRRAVSLVAVGSTVITENSSHQIFTPGAVAIEGASIVDIDRPDVVAGRYTAAETIEARDEVVMPGLVNTHTHAPMVMFR